MHSSLFLIRKRPLYGRILSPELSERIPREPEPFAYVGDRFVLLQHADDLLLIVDQHLLFRKAALFTAEDHSFRLAQGQGFLGSHGNQIALDFRHQSESEAKDFAVDGIVERIPLLGSIEIDLPGQTLAHDSHDVRQRPAQPRNFRHDQRVSRLHPLEKSAKFAVALALTAADHLRDPAVDYEILTVGETPDFILLVSQILLARTNPEISYNHYSEKLSEGDVAFIRKK